MKVLGFILFASLILVDPPQSFEGLILYESIDNSLSRDTTYEYYTANKMLSVFNAKNPVSKYLIIIGDNNEIQNFSQNRVTKKWTKFIIPSSKIDRPVLFNSNDSMVILDQTCRAIEFKPSKTSNQGVTIIKSIKSYLSDNLYFYINDDPGDALNRIQLFREIKITSSNKSINNVNQRKAILIKHMKPDPKLFEIPPETEILETKK